MERSVPVYVRKGQTPTQRTITFRIDQLTDAFTASDLLERGFAIDGNTAVCTVELADLLDAQRAVMALFEVKQLTPAFV